MIDETIALLGPAFKTKEFATRLNASPGYGRLALHRLKKSGKLVPIRRGWWAKPDTLPIEAAAILSYPCYVSFHSALSIHGLTTQIPRLVQIAVCRQAKRYEIGSEQVQEYKIPREDFRDFSTRGDLPLASPEKAFADCLLLPRACPSVILQEVASQIDLWKVKAYCTPRMTGRLKKVLSDAEPR